MTNKDKWKCPSCGYAKGGFKLLGMSFIQCPKCNEVCFVTKDEVLLARKERKDVTESRG